MELNTAGIPLYGFLLLKLGWQSDLLISQVKAISPQTKVMLRGWRTNEPGFDWEKVTRADGYAYAEEYFKTWVHGDNLLADYHQIINEPSDICPPVQVANFWHGAMDAAAEHNPSLKLGILCYAERNPPLPTDIGKPHKDFWTSKAIHDMLRRAKREGHILMLHEYVIKGDTEQGVCYPWGKDAHQSTRLYRHQIIYSLLPPDLRDLELWLGEAGDLRSLKCGVDQFVKNVNRYMDGIAEDDYLKSVNLWTIGHAASEQWLRDRLDAAIPDLLWMLLHR